MKKSLMTAGAVLVLISSLWFLNQPIQLPRARRSPVGAPGPIDAPAQQRALAQSSESVAVAGIPNDTNRVGGKASARRVAVDLSAAVDPALTGQVRQALEDLRGIYASAGSLDWDQAKALIARRETATQELVGRLARL